jgi:hypothetical protein
MTPKGSITVVLTESDALLVVKALRACALVTMYTAPKAKMRDMALQIESAVAMRGKDKRERARIRQRDWRKRQRAIQDALREYVNGRPSEYRAANQ